VTGYKNSVITKRIAELVVQLREQRP
jgi:hypothetical protein